MGRASGTNQFEGLCQQCGRCAGRRLQEKQFGKRNPNGNKNLAEIKHHQAQQHRGDCRSYRCVCDLAKSAGRVILPVGMLVRNNLQQEEKRYQRQGQGRGHHHAVVPPHATRPLFPYSAQIPLSKDRNNFRLPSPRNYSDSQIDAAQAPKRCPCTLGHDGLPKCNPP
jgi:hypothetical protein